MAAVGYASLPITVSLRGIQGVLQEKLSKPTEAAAKKAGDAIRKNLADGAKAAQSDIEKATRWQESALKKVADAERGVEAAKSKVEVATRAQQAAEIDLERTVSAGKAKVAKAQADYEALVKSGTATVEQLADAERKAADAADKAKSDQLKAENRLEGARQKAASATRDFSAATEELAKSQHNAQKATDDLEAATVRLDRANDMAAGGVGRLGGALDTVKSATANAASQVGAFAEKFQVHATVALGAMGVMGKGIAEYAAEAEQSYGAVESIFGNHANKIVEESKKAAQAVGLSGREYRELSAVTGAMLKNLGLPVEEATETTKKLVGVGADLAATFGGSTKEAMEAIGSLLRGEADPIERYGVSIKKADINARLAADGLDKLEGEALKQAEAQTLLTMLMESTTDAQGQFAREAGTAANAAQKSTAAWGDAKEKLGDALLPIYSKLAEVGAFVANVFSEHPALIIGIAGAIASLAVSTIVIAQISSAFTGLSAAAAAAGTTVSGLMAGFAATAGIVLAWAAAIAAVGVALWAFFTKTEVGKQLWDSLVSGLKSGWDWVQGTFITGWDYLVEKFTVVKDAFVGVKNVLFSGEFTGGIFGLSEDHPVIKFLFRARELFFQAKDAVVEFATQTGGKLAALWQSLQPGFEWLKSFVSDSLGNTFANLGSTLTSLKDALVSIGSAIASGLMAALSGVWEMLKGLWEFLAPVLIPALKFLGAVIGGVVVGAFMLLVKAFEWVTRLVAGVADKFAWFGENVLSPLIVKIGEIAQVIYTALGQAFTYIWPIIEQLGVVVGHVWDGIKAAFDGIVTVAQYAFTILATVVITPLLLLWKGLAAGIGWAWENLIKPAWNAMAVAGQWLWDNILKPAFDGIKQGFTKIGEIVQSVWTGFIKPVWEAIASAAEWLGNNVIRPVLDAIVTAFRNLGSAFVQIFDSVIKPLFDAFQRIAEFLWENLSKKIFSAIEFAFERVGQGFRWVWENIIKPTWDALGAGIKWVVDNVVTPAFEGIQNGLSTLRGWFDTAVEAIGKTWDTIKEKTAKPINFVIDTVYNNGIRKVWDSVSDFVGLDKKLPEIPTAKYATGGVLPGYTPGKDVHDFRSPTGGRLLLSGGEAIMRPEWVRAVGGKPAIDSMNAAARRGGVDGVRRQISQAHGHYAMGGVLPTQAFASGGIIASITGLVKRFFPMMTITSDFRPGDPGYHGRGMAVDASNGTDTTPQMQEMSRFFYRNYGKGLAELIHWPLRGWENIKHGRPLNYGEPTNTQHRNHVHIASTAALPAPGEEFAPLGDTGGGFGGFLRDRIASVVKAILDPIGAAIPQFGGFIGDFPRAAFDWIKDKVVGFIQSSAGSYSGADGVSGNAESWREMMIAAYRRQGYEPTPAKIDAWIRQIHTESRGDPNIAQQIVDQNGTGEAAGVGLGQMIPGTWALYRDPELPNDRRDPWAMTNAMVRYGEQKYGDKLLDVIGHGHGYAMGGVLPAKLYDSGGILTPNGLAVNLSGKPEAVLTAEQWDTLRKASTELKEAFAGRGKGFTATGVLIGDDALAKRIVEVTAAIGDFLGTSAKSLKAMEDLEAARASHTDQSKAVAEAEKELEEARKAAKEAASKTGEVSKSATRKVQDAEQALAKARKSGKADKIADAEKRLARAREDLADAQKKSNDKVSSSGEKASDKVEKAEKKLAAARKKAAAEASKLAKAEQAIILARVETAVDLFKAVADGLRTGLESAALLAGAMADAAKSIDDTRQLVSQLSIQVATARIGMVKAALDLQTAEFDLQRSRVKGLISVAEAEQRLEDAKRQSTLQAYDAFGFAINRYREAGLDAWGRVTEGAVNRTNKVRAAEADLAAAQAQALLDQHLAHERVRAAAHAAAQASLVQQKAVAMLAISTQKLEAQAARLYGLQGSEATAAQRGMNGVAKGTGGLLGILGSAAGAVVNFMAGNIPGAIASAIGGIKSIGDAFTGFREYHRNKKEANQAFKGLSGGDKAALIIGGLGGAAAIGGGAYLAAEGHGADVAQGGIQIGSEIINTAFKNVAENLKTDFDRIELEHKIRSEALEREFEAKKSKLEISAASEKAASDIKTAELTSVLELAKINKQIAESTNAKVIEQLKKLADIQLANRDAAVNLHEESIKQLGLAIAEANKIADDAEERSKRVGAEPLVVEIRLPKKAAYSAEEVEVILKSINSSQEAMEIRLAELEKEKQASAWDLVSAARGN